MWLLSCPCSYLLYKLRPQFKHISSNQFLPNKGGPLPFVTTKGRFFTCPSTSTATMVCPSTDSVRSHHYLTLLQRYASETDRCWHQYPTPFLSVFHLEAHALKCCMLTQGISEHQRWSDLPPLCLLPLPHSPIDW